MCVFDLNNRKVDLRSRGIGDHYRKNRFGCGNNEGFILDTLGFRCLKGGPGTPCRKLGSQVSHVYLCSLPKAFRVLGVKAARDHTAEIRFSDSLLNAPHSSSQPWLLQEPGVRCAASGLQCPFPSGSRSPSPSSQPQTCAHDTYRKVLFHNSY